MKAFYLKTIVVIACYILLACVPLFAQESPVAAGSNATGSGGSSSYSVGQVAYSTNFGSNGSMAQGVQQAYEISVVSGMEESSIYLDCLVYPNPTTDFLKLTVETNFHTNLSYQIYDENGKVLEIKKIEGLEITINMSSLAAATYFLKVNNNADLIKTFKIIKH